MAGPSVVFKKLLFTHDKMSRDRILYKLTSWLQEQWAHDPRAAQCYMSIQNLCNVNGYQSDQEFKQNAEWFTMFTHDECVSFQEIVKAELAIPVTNIAERIKQLSNSMNASNALDASSVIAVDAASVVDAASTANPANPANPVKEKVKQRRAIPKKIRGLTWKEHFGDSMRGACFCCKKTLEALDEWHAGHIVSHANGGKDTVVNLRPVCISCNLSMGTENMDDFKARCYSA